MDFQFLGETIHTFAILFLFFSVIFHNFKKKNSLGISLKTQLILLLVFVARGCHLLTSDLFKTDTYCYVHQITQVSFTFGTVLLLLFSKNGYDKENDKFRYEYLIFPPIILAVLVNLSFDLTMGLYTFSILLEPLAVIPQMHLIFKMKRVTRTVAAYLYGMGLQDLISKYINCCYNSPISEASSVASFVYLGVYITCFILMMYLRVKVCSQCANENKISVPSDFIRHFPNANIEQEKKGRLDSDFIWIEGNKERLEDKEILETKECLENREIEEYNSKASIV